MHTKAVLQLRGKLADARTDRRSAQRRPSCSGDGRVPPGRPSSPRPPPPDARPVAGSTGREVGQDSGSTYRARRAATPQCRQCGVPVVGDAPEREPSARCADGRGDAGRASTAASTGSARSSSSPSVSPRSTTPARRAARRRSHGAVARHARAACPAAGRDRPAARCPGSSRSSAAGGVRSRGATWGRPACREPPAGAPARGRLAGRRTPLSTSETATPGAPVPQALATRARPSRGGTRRRWTRLPGARGVPRLWTTASGAAAVDGAGSTCPRRHVHSAARPGLRAEFACPPRL